MLLGGLDFTKYSYTAKSLSGGDIVIKYGQFVQSTFDFLVIAFAVFIFVVSLSKALKKPLKAEAAKPADLALLEEIRDLLAGKKPELKTKTATIKTPKKTQK